MAAAGGETDGEAGGRGATGEPFTPGSLAPLRRSPMANRHFLLWQLLRAHYERPGGGTQVWSAGDSWPQPPHATSCLELSRPTVLETPSKSCGLSGILCLALSTLTEQSV